MIPLPDWEGLMRRLIIFLMLWAGALAGAQASAAERRLALVVGNSAYKNVPPLANPANDAKLIAETLQGLGFKLVGGGAQLDLDKTRFDRLVQEFGSQLQGAEVGLFYYAGHGVQVRGANYLVPVNANPVREVDVDFQMLDSNLVLRQMESARARLNLVILDACRNNPFGGRGLRAATSGLAQMQATEGTLISFATQPGNVALDGTSGNSPFTKALAEVLRRPGLGLFEVFNEVGLVVKRSTGGAQQPWVSSSPISGAFFFAGRTDAAPTPAKPAAAKDATPPAAAKVPDTASLEIAFWDSIKDAKNPRLFEAYLRRYPKGTFSEIAKISLEDLNASARKPTIDQPADKNLISEPGLLKEVRERLYELNFDPGPFVGPLGTRTRQAIREFEGQSKLAQTGEPTQGLLKRLREIGGLKPWGAIVYAQSSQKWGMSWSQTSRRDAVENARKSCGNAAQCGTEISFFGTECGVFAHSGSAWAIVARNDVARAKEDALADCGKRSKSCRVIATVCADGADRLTAN
jgi:uncharacterized caspase-like protein